MSRDTFHHCEDGRGHRQVFVNGNKISRVVWADEERGVVCFHPEPLRCHRRGPLRVYSRNLRGRVTVVFNDEAKTK